MEMYITKISIAPDLYNKNGDRNIPAEKAAGEGGQGH